MEGRTELEFNGAVPTPEAIERRLKQDDNCEAEIISLSLIPDTRRKSRSADH
jgi:hypothetical protein